MSRGGCTRGLGRASERQVFQAEQQPLAATIWSIPPKHIIENISIRTIAEGFHSTDMLKLFHRSPWYIVQGGSCELDRIMPFPNGLDRGA
jgi:predicted NAD/FAD-binding protein